MRSSTYRFLFLAVVAMSLASGFAAFAQQDGQSAPTSKIYLEYADVQSYDQDVNADRQVLTGNVCFRHDSAFMYCDSAYLYDQSSSLEAFGTVRMEQGDTLFLYGNYLFYDGHTQLAKVRENVRMESFQPDSSVITLFTDSLNYDRVADIGYYFDGGMIVDAENELTSIYGRYSPGTKLAVFNDSVQLNNPDFILTSDTLHYYTDTKIAVILGPSVIVSDSGTVYTSRGWYNTAENTSQLTDRSTLVSSNRILIGDSIAHNRETGFGEAFGNVFLQDTLNKIILEGQYGQYNEKTEYAYVSDSARCMEYSQGDTLYAHADLFEMATVDSIYRELKAWHGVRFYRSDLQGVCDSMQFNTKDTILRMYIDPILWNEQYQLTGDVIEVFMNDSTVDCVHVVQYAFAIQELDSSSYNQLKGNDLKASFEGRLVSLMDIEGSVETIYYPLEEDGTMIGMNETKSSYLRMWFKDGKYDKLKMWPKGEGTLTPLPYLQPDRRKLKGFYWYDYLRPRHKDDIYRVVKRKTEDIPPARSNRFQF
jgi:prepilin-type processing-associated H-X9-DG protein